MNNLISGLLAICAILLTITVYLSLDELIDRIGRPPVPDECKKNYSVWKYWKYWPISVISIMWRGLLINYTFWKNEYKYGRQIYPPSKK